MEESKNIEMRAETPSFVYRDGMTANIEYVEWLSEVKARFHRSQIKASVRVNTSMLEFYWSVGRDLVALRAEERWGAGVVKQFALDMRQTFPDETGFSHTNVKYMKQWYSFYYDRFTKSHQNGGQMPTAGKSHQVGGQLEMPEKFGVYTDKTIVEWSLQDIQKPLGVASYQLQEVVERTIAEIENNK